VKGVKGRGGGGGVLGGFKVTVLGVYQVVLPVLMSRTGIICSTGKCLDSWAKVEFKYTLFIMTYEQSNYETTKRR
jgi:hypothetical protein